MKIFVADNAGWLYQEGVDQFMVRTPIPDILTISRTRGELAFKQVENENSKHVVVFGWIEKCEALSNGRARITVTPLSELHRRVLLEPIQEATEGAVNFW